MTCCCSAGIALSTSHSLVDFEPFCLRICGVTGSDGVHPFMGVYYPFTTVHTMSDSSGPSISRSKLSEDLDALLQIPRSSFASLLSAQKDVTAPKDSSSALESLNTYSPNQADPETSRSLIKAYIRDMRGEVLAMDRGEGERLGWRIDGVREKGEGLAEALGNVKV